MITKYATYCYAFFLALLYPLGFAPIHLPALTLISLLGWTVLCLNQAQSPLHAAQLGLIYFSTLFMVATHWLTISLSIAGGLPTAAAWLLVMGLAMLIALGHGILGALYHCIYKQNRHFALIVLATVWVALEWLRAHICTGFPWLLLAQSQLDMPWASLIPILGPYGIAWLTLMLLLLTTHRTLRTLSYLLIITTLTWAYGLQSHLWTKPLPTQLTPPLIALQPNLSLSDKWGRNPSNTLDELKQQSPPQKGAWLVWPEGSLIVPDRTTMHHLNHWLTHRHQILLTGLLTHNYNAIISAPAPHQVYYKQYMVPFGEYNPLPTFMTHWLEAIWPTIPMSDLQKGPKRPPFILEHQTLAPALCYDVVFPQFIEHIPSNIGWILTLTEDVWFGDSWAAEQHLQAAQLRSLEVQKPQLFVNNSGPSAGIDPHGQIHYKTLDHVATYFIMQIIPYEGATPYQRHGHTPWLLVATLITILTTWWANHFKKAR